MVNINDKVPKTPGLLVNENVPFLAKLLDPLPWTYSHVGVELELNDRDSMHLNQEKSGIWTTHNLEVYLHLVDGLGRYDDGWGRNLSQLGQAPHSLYYQISCLYSLLVLQLSLHNFYFNFGNLHEIWLDELSRVLILKLISLEEEATHMVSETVEITYWASSGTIVDITSCWIEP